jgi:hypothetical protein
MKATHQQCRDGFREVPSPLLPPPPPNFKTKRSVVDLLQILHPKMAKILDFCNTCGQPLFKNLGSNTAMLLNYVTSKHYTTYICEIVGDKQCCGDIKALHKGRLLVESERILAVSFLKQQDSIYLSGIVGAAMKNKVKYLYH